MAEVAGLLSIRSVLWKKKSSCVLSLHSVTLKDHGCPLRPARPTRCW